MDLHHYYDQLTDAEREAVDHWAQQIMQHASIYADMKLDGSDAAERAVDGLARWVIESRKEG